METLVEEQNSAVATCHQTGDRGPQNANDVVSRTAAQVRANGTVVFTSPAQVKQVVASSSNTTQAIAVPQPGGTVSIVHVSIPNQPVHVQSVIQPGPNQQSVIQAPGGTTLQSLPKNVILLNKGSVIHSADAESGVHPVQLIQASKESDGISASLATYEDESKKRREILARRPSYRRILNELSSTEAQGAVTALTHVTDVKDESLTANGGHDTASQDSETNGANTITVSGAQYHTAGLLKVLPASTIQLSSQDGSLQELQTLTMGNSNAGAGTIVQYAQGQDGQIFVPVTVSASDLQAYQIRTTGAATSLTQGVVMATSSTLPAQQLAEEASRKREMRLLKNREAAKECRRKKKEYIKCLENRVAVLENQNKALIEELKSLKKLYCEKND